MRRLLVGIFCVAMMAGCQLQSKDSGSEAAMNPDRPGPGAPEEPAADEAPSCFDSELVRVKCMDGQVFSHAGCPGPER